MACILIHSMDFIENMLTTAFLLLSRHSKPYPIDLGRGAIGMLESIGFSYVPQKSGFDIVDEEAKPIIRIRTMIQFSHINIYVEPAQLVLRTAEQIQLSVLLREVTL